MPYGHLIAATVMTLGVCQGRSSIASFSILTSASRGPSAIPELLVKMAAIRRLRFSKVWVFNHLESTGGLICAILQTFVKIGQRASEISRFFIVRVVGEISFRQNCLVASVCVHVCPSVCPYVCPFDWAFSRLNRLTLIFGMRVDLILGYPGIVGQGSRSKVKVKQWKFLRSPVWTSGAEQVDIRTRLAKFSQW